MVLHGCMLNWQGRCNSVAWIYGQLAGGSCNSVAWIYGQLAGGSICHSSMLHITPHKSICQQYRCTFSYIWNIFGVIVLYAAMVIWGEVHLPSVFMCILQYVKLIWYNGLACTYGWLTGGSICLWDICALSYVWNLCGVMILHAAMVDCLGQPSACGIYVHSRICETYEV